MTHRGATGSPGYSSPHLLALYQPNEGCVI